MSQRDQFLPEPVMAAHPSTMPSATGKILSSVEPTAAEALLTASSISGLTCIGQITSGTTAELEMPDGRIVPLPRIGYTHTLNPGT